MDIFSAALVRRRQRMSDGTFEREDWVSGKHTVCRSVNSECDTFLPPSFPCRVQEWSPSRALAAAIHKEQASRL